ncbi:LuxR C-terminal-related transcriptional regulator [Gordonia sp. NB41Y]|uniref:helix-turn-helix transcriptional regulator n=1 Tax=Gordonia sp. NB41Y TaxID=875808 RepID=UPI0006B1EEDF|nr:LuxR C-terminal-related transcriptional regulator [Gordonia sp. NB41Y]KOY49707.1 LuxR family transcriptional regulator [Gordonia sp. NB41Y]WLP92222.1 LuxR C-terminal-related transcriptional regulator [Gordonia sp. NB41Y]
MPDNPLLRPDDADTVRAELREAQRSTGLPVLFGGVVDGPDLLLSGFVGTRSTVLRDLVISSRCGLGGRTIVERRAGSIPDYFNSTEITHDYDREVSGEGIESLLAAPAVVGGRTRAVLYGGLRSPAPIGDTVVTRMVVAARRLAREIEVRDEVDRRVAHLDRTRTETAPMPTSVADGIIESYVALREIAASTTDPALAEQLRGVEERLRGLGAVTTAPNAARLSGRENDVLAHLALGCSNAEVAERLALRPETVKGYVKNLRAKLGVHNRHEAVVEARRQGLLP